MLPADFHLPPSLAAYALALSAALFVIGLAAAPIVITRMPPDYFFRTEPRARRHPVVAMAFRTVSNILGAVLLVAGVAMLVLPGQGLLTILVALSLLRFPGKRGLQRRLLALRPLRRAISAIRRRAGKPPLQL